jgi:hypothetical protein
MHFAPEQLINKFAARNKSLMKNFIVLLFIFFLLLPATSFAQILINEVSSAADTAFLDEDKSMEDWIEFYNTTSAAINMNGYKIIRDESGRTKSWTFPDILIKAHSYLTVFCSEKNRTDWFDHWEVPVYANNVWKYFPGTTEPPATWRDITFNDAAWATGIGGIGYGDGDDSTLIAADTSLYMRKSFLIADTSKIAIGALLIDFDDAFVAYLNGVEIARANIGIYGDHPAHNTMAYEEHEALLYQAGIFSGGFYIYSNVIDSALKPGLNVFSIQTHNYKDGMNDMSCIPYFLIGVKDTTITYFPFPAEIHLHTDFNLTNTGQILKLKNPSDVLVDSVNIGYMEMNHTRERIPDGTANWCISRTPTPDSTNNFSYCNIGYTNSPVINLPAGFYSGTQSVSMSGSAGDIIRYTRDGSVPGIFSPVYSSAVTVIKSQVIRARSFSSSPNVLPGPVAANTYFINENVSVPVVSLSTDPNNLFDKNYGIYVFGPNADTINFPFFGANFWQDWSRPAHIEFFDESNDERFELNCELKIQGNYSKGFPQRGFTVKAKDDYGGYPVLYQLFPDKPVTEYKSFNIRNAGSDWNKCHMLDRINQKNVQSLTHLDIMDGRPCVLFINGAYWGMYELRERQDKFYIANNHNVDADKLDFLEFDGKIIEGSNSGFLNMVNYIASNSMTVEANYDSVQRMIDIENFADYFIVETFIVNVDWLGSYTNNIKYWRTNDPIGKWRYMLWDTDLSLGRNSSTGSASTNMLDRAINPVKSNPHSVMFKALLNNTGFRNYFVNRYCDLLNTIYIPDNFKSTANKLHDEMFPEIARHFQLWGNFDSLPYPYPLYYPLLGLSEDVPSWEQNIDTVKSFMDARPYYVFNQLQNQFSLPQQVDVTLNVSPAGSGTIKMNTIYPGTFPWSGIYMDGVPVTMTASASPGYRFSHWKSPTLIASPLENASVTLNVNHNEAFTAYFEQLELSVAVYPNPFDENLQINFQLPAEAQVSLKLYNALNQEIAELVSDRQFTPAGMHQINLESKAYSLAGGFYYLKYTTNNLTQVFRVMKVKH